MLAQDAGYLREDDLYKGFSVLSRNIILRWRNYVVDYGDLQKIKSKFEQMKDHLASNNLIVLFDHHYAFDALPLGLGLARFAENVSSVIIPYAVHLDMGIGREGEPSLRYFLRSKLFKWFIDDIRKPNPSIRFFPVVREFERDNPRLFQIVEQEFSGINSTYLKSLVRQFRGVNSGQVCFLTPFSGIGFPEKPLLHPQLYRSIDLVQAKCERDFPLFIAGAYPSWRAYSNYLAPLLTKHLIVLRGPFYLPRQDYEAAYRVIESEITEIRRAADFAPPDYKLILNK